MLGLLFIYFSVAAAASSSCSPLTLPITDVELETMNTRRGIRVTVGDSEQVLSVMPHVYLNDTWLYNSTAMFCNTTGMAPNQCYTSRGGYYDPSLSKTSQAQSDVEAAGGDESDTARALSTHVWYSGWVTDELNILDNVTLKSFPIGMPGFDVGGDFDRQSNLGFGRNSTLLNALSASDDIASRVYSFWWGLETATASASMDGAMVLGGYDAAKVTGNNITLDLQPWSVSCESGLVVTVTDLVLDFPNGTETSIISPDTFEACLQPDFPILMTLNADPYYINFENYTQTAMIDRTYGNYFGVGYYPPNEVYAGDLTITLNGALPIKISNDILVVPDAYVSDAGVSMTNTSISDVVITPTVGVNVSPNIILGSQFFSAAYMMVDLDQGTFTLWQANPTTDSDVVAVGSKCQNAVSDPTVNSSPNSTTSTSAATKSAVTASPSETPAKSSDAGTPVGTIVGVALGAAFGAAALASLAVVLILRRRRNARSREGSSVALTDIKHNPADGGNVSGDSPGHPQYYEPMSGELLEMPDGRIRPRELYAFEKPAEMTDIHSPLLEELPGRLPPKSRNVELAEME